jgi:hypothetical protein
MAPGIRFPTDVRFPCRATFVPSTSAVVPFKARAWREVAPPVVACLLVVVRRLPYGTGEGGTISTIKQAASEFLAYKRIAMTGVSCSGGNHGGNFVYQRLRDRGYEVFAINPKDDTVEGDTVITT